MSTMTQRLRSDPAWFGLIALTALLLNHRMLFLGSLINADPTQQVWLHLDEATVNYDAKRIADGQVMYRDFFAFQGPVHYHLFALFFRAFGPSYLIARWVTVLMMSATAGIVAVLLRQVLGQPTDCRPPRWEGWLAGASGALLHACAFAPTWSCTYPHWTAEFFLMAGIGFLVVASRSLEGRLQLACFFAAGTSFAASALTIQSHGMPPLIAVSVAMFALAGLGKRSFARAKPVLCFVLGASGPIFVVAIGFAWAEGLQAMLHNMFVWPFESYGPAQSDAQGYASYLHRTLGNHARLGPPWSWCGWVLGQLTAWGPRLAFFGAWLALLVRLVALIRGRIPSRAEEAQVLIAISAGAAASPLVLGVTRNDMTHLAFLGTSSLVGVVAAFALLPLGRWKYRIPAVFLAAVLGFVLPNHINMHRYTSADTRSWPEFILAESISRRLQPHLVSGEGLFDTTYFGSMRYFYLEDTPSPMTFIPPLSLWNYYTDKQWRRLAAALVENPPPVMQLSAGQFSRLLRVEPRLNQLYSHQGQNLYLRK